MRGENREIGFGGNDGKEIDILGVLLVSGDRSQQADAPNARDSGR